MTHPIRKRSPDQDRSRIEQLVQSYFDGLHFADTDLLTTIFHPDCVLKAPELRRDITEWLAQVKARKTPAAIGDPYRYRLLRLELEGEQALAKISCPLLGNDFIDYLGFLYEKGEWRIVNKMYADRPTKEDENQ